MFPYRLKSSQKSRKMSRDNDLNISETEQPFISHLIELRDRIIKSLLAIAIVFGGLSFWANDVYAYLAGPLTKHMPPGRR